MNLVMQFSSSNQKVSYSHEIKIYQHYPQISLLILRNSGNIMVSRVDGPQVYNKLCLLRKPFTMKHANKGPFCDTPTSNAVTKTEILIRNK